MKLPLITTTMLLLLASLGRAQDCNEDLGFVPNDPAVIKEHGSAVAIEGGVVAIGARSDASQGSPTGAVYLFDAATGAQTAKLFASNGQAWDRFGCSLDLHGGILAVGADRVSSPAHGKVYLFDVATGTELREIQPQRPPANSGFGRSVALSDRYLAVAAPYDDGDRAYGGAVYVFDPQTGAQLRRFPTPTGAIWYGWSVAIDGDVLAVGSPRHQGQGGMVLVYDLVSGVQLARLSPRDRRSDDRFGQSVALEGSRLVAGAPQNIGDGNFSGAVYEFDWTTQRQVARFVGNRPVGGERFGESLALEGSKLVVGAPYGEHSPVSVPPGSAYVFDLTSGQRLAQLFPSDGRSYVDSSMIGYSVDLDGGKAAVGAPGTSQWGQDAGASYRFDVGEGACWSRSEYAGAPGVDWYPELRGDGPLRPGGNVELHLSKAAPNAPSFLVLGLGESLDPFGGGTLYPTLDFLNFRLRTDAQGELRLGGSYPVGAPVMPLYFQVWVLDPVAWKGFAGSYGLRGSVY